MIALERYTDTAKINVCNRKSGVLSVVKSNIKLSHKLNTKKPISQNNKKCRHSIMPRLPIQLLPWYCGEPRIK